MEEYEGRIEWMNYLKIIWKRKWIIIIPAFLCAIVAGVFSFLQPPVWEVDTIIQGGKFFDMVRNEEVVIVEGEQLAGQIDEGYYNNLILTDLNMDVKEMPQLKVKNLRWTDLVQVSIRENNVEKAKLILSTLFKYLKEDLDKKINSQIKSSEAQIAHWENIIEMENLGIQSREIEISKLNQDVLSSINRLKKSEENYKNIMDQMNAVLEKGDEQDYFRSYYVLGQKLSFEKLAQEELRLFISRTEADIRLLNSEIEDKTKSIETSKKEVNLLKEKRGQINPTQFIKEPTSSLHPVGPRKKLNILIAGVLGLFVFGLFAFFLEYLEKLKRKD